MIYYSIETLVNAGIKEIMVVTGGNHAGEFLRLLGNGHQFGLKHINYTYQEGEGGIAKALSLAEHFADSEKIVVILGDNIIEKSIKRAVEDFRKQPKGAKILVKKVPDPERFGVAELNGNGKLVRLVEKPKEPPSNYALTGIYFFRPMVFEMIRKLKPSWRNELEITEAIQLLLESGHNVGYEFVKDWWKDTGTPEDILEANRLVLDELKHHVEGVIENDASVQGRVAVGAESLVKRNALIRGPAIIGRKTMVNSNVYIGPYTSIGGNCTIEKGEVENSIIMDNCIINISDRITDSIIASHSRITTSQNTPHGKKFILGERTYIEL